MKLLMTEDLPKEEGYYWWSNFSEHTPTILYVEMNNDTGELHASNGEFNFVIRGKEPQMELPLEDEDEEFDDRELWHLIPNPTIDGEEVKPDSY